MYWFLGVAGRLLSSPCNNSSSGGNCDASKALVWLLHVGTRRACARHRPRDAEVHVRVLCSTRYAIKTVVVRDLWWDLFQDAVGLGWRQVQSQICN